MIERHQPIKSGEGEAKDKEWDKAVGGMTESESDARIPIRVLAHGEMSIEKTGSREKDQVKSAAKIEKRFVEERLFPREEWVR